MNSFVNKTKSIFKSPSNTPEKSVTESEDAADFKLKCRSIQAFRTIITMLHLVPNQRVMSVLHRNSERGEEDTELKLLNALATLLVRSNEVAAVAVTNYDKGSGARAIQVIACHHLGGDKPSDNPTISQTPTALTRSSGVFKFKNILAAFNIREDNPDYRSTSNFPAIIDPICSIPSNLQKTEKIELIRTHCFDTW
jgi:hypothetical protein